MILCQEATKYVDIPAIYKVRCPRDESGNLLIDYEMPEKDYKDYKEMNNAIMQQIKNSSSAAASCLRTMSCSIDKSWLSPIYQKDDCCKAISYPSPGDQTRTFATSGMFPLVFWTVLKFFGKNETLENIARIANYGRWQHDNGTWWHFLDVMSTAYGLEVGRLSNFMTMIRCIEENGITPVLLNKSVHPTGKGNLLVIPVEFNNGDVTLYSPVYYNGFKKMSISYFTRNTIMMWAIGEPEESSN